MVLKSLALARWFGAPSRHHYYNRSCTAYVGYAQNVNGQSLDLYTLDWSDMAYNLQNAAMTFVNSQGQQQF